MFLSARIGCHFLIILNPNVMIKMTEILWPVFAVRTIQFFTIQTRKLRKYMGLYPDDKDYIYKACIAICCRTTPIWVKSYQQTQIFQETPMSPFSPVYFLHLIPPLVLRNCNVTIIFTLKKIKISNVTPLQQLYNYMATDNKTTPWVLESVFDIARLADMGNSVPV